MEARLSRNIAESTILHRQVKNKTEASLDNQFNIAPVEAIGWKETETALDVELEIEDQRRKLLMSPTARAHVGHCHVTDIREVLPVNERTRRRAPRCERNRHRNTAMEWCNGWQHVDDVQN